jgi:hypothetical protein
MFNRKVTIAVIMVVFVGLISALNVNSAEVQKMPKSWPTAKKTVHLKCRKI